MPSVSHPRMAAALAAARITAFRPGQSPPPVTMPIFFFIQVAGFLILPEWPGESPFALDSFNESFHAGLDVGRVSFIGVNVHGKRKARVHAHQHIAKDQLAIASDA